MASSTRMRLSSILTSLAARYVVGMFPSADLADRLAGHDGEVRRSGSHNPGATNAAKVLGRGWGAAVLAADVAKGATGAIVGRTLGGPWGMATGGLAAVLGHCFPLGRPGGKGVASRYGALVVAVPEVAIVDLATAAIVAKTTRRPGPAMAAAIAVSAVGASWLPRRTGRLQRRGPGLVLTALSGAAVLFRFIQEQEDAKGPPVVE